MEGDFLSYFIFFQRKNEDKISLTKREKCQSKMESGFLFYFIFFQRKNKYKFLLQKEKNVNQKWKVISFSNKKK